VIFALLTKLRSLTARRVSSSSRGHLWEVFEGRELCMYCYEPRTREREREACRSNSFFRPRTR
jgi:hypothetical protein